MVYAASIRRCRPCPLREQCQWNGGATAKPRQVSVLLHPLLVGDKPCCSGGTGAAENIGVPACSSCAINASRCVCPHPTTRRFSRERRRDLFSRATRSYSSFVGDTAGSQCTERHFWSGHVQAHRGSQRLRAPSGPDGGLERTRSPHEETARSNQLLLASLFAWPAQSIFIGSSRGNPPGARACRG